MNAHDVTLWQLIKALIDHPSFAHDEIKKFIPVEFSRQDENRYFSFYEGDRLILIDHVEIKMIDLRVSRMGEKFGLLGLLDISSTTCITVDEVYTHYPDITPVPPRGHMLVDAVFYHVRKPWGLLTFGFADRKHECLASVVLDRIKPASEPTG